MWDSPLFTDTVTRLRAVETESAKGGTSLNWSEPDSLLLPRASIQTKGTSTSPDGRLSQQFVVYADLGIDVKAEDRLQWTNQRGEVYILNVVGVPQTWQLGTVSHTEILAEVIDG